MKIFLTLEVCYFIRLVMFSFAPFFTLLQAAIGVLSLRDQSKPDFLRELWNRVGRMGRRLEKLLAQWRAGTLPQARARGSEAGQRAERVRAPGITLPETHGWLAARMPDIHQKLGDWQLMVSQEECARFLDEVPQARKIVAVLERMLFVPAGKKRATRKRAEVWPPPAWVRAVETAKMIVGPTGRLQWL